MKKTIITSTILLLTSASFAQTGGRQLTKQEVAKNGPIPVVTFDGKDPQTVPTKPQYQKVVQIPVDDFNLLTGQLNERKNTVIYQPGIKPEDAVNIQKQIDAYLNELPKRVKLDSIAVTTK